MASPVFDYQTESVRVEEALREDFPKETIDTSEGYKGRVHVKPVLRFFNGKSQQEKQAYIRDLLKDKLGDNAQAVSPALVSGTDEL